MDQVETLSVKLSRRALIASMFTASAAVAFGRQSIVRSVVAPALASSDNCASPTDIVSPPDLIRVWDRLGDILSKVPPLPVKGLTKAQANTKSTSAESLKPNSLILQKEIKKAFGDKSPLRANRVAVYVSYASPIVSKKIFALGALREDTRTSEIKRAISLLKKRDYKAFYNLPNIGKIGRSVLADVAAAAQPVAEASVRVQNSTSALLDQYNKMYFANIQTLKELGVPAAELKRIQQSISSLGADSAISEVAGYGKGFSPLDQSRVNDFVYLQQYFEGYGFDQDLIVASSSVLLDSEVIDHDGYRFSAQSGFASPGLLDPLLGMPAKAVEPLTAALILSLAFLALIGAIAVIIILAAVATYAAQLAAQLEAIKAACDQDLRLECAKDASELMLRREVEASRRLQACLARAQYPWDSIFCNNNYNESVLLGLRAYERALAACGV